MTSVSRRYAAAPAASIYPPAAADEARAPVVLMVSGGADSTALLVLAATSALDVGDGRGSARIARERLHVLHVNHQLRGLDAEEDEEFVRDLAARYGIPCTVRRVDVAARAALNGSSHAQNSAAASLRTQPDTGSVTEVEVMNDFLRSPGVLKQQKPSWQASDTRQNQETSFITSTSVTKGSHTPTQPDVSSRETEYPADAAPGASANLEAVGREVRYAAAAELANELSAIAGTPRSAARILTAHTANDRAETFFMNALRGTGPAGLASIPRQRGRIVRPLLDRTHAELCELLRMRGIVWREDATNADTRYLRAFVRHEVLPTLASRNPRVLSSVATTCDILSDEDAYLTRVAARAYREFTRRQAPGLVALDAARLAATDVAVARRVIRQALLAVCPDARLEARHVTAVLTCVARGAGSVTVPVDVDTRVEHGLLFVRLMAPAADRPLAAWLTVPGWRDARARAVPSGLASRARGAGPGGAACGRLALPDGRALVARLVQAPPGTRAPELARAHATEWANASVLLDATACGIDPTGGGCLWVDAPAPGDVLCPLGMHGQSKKLSDLLGEAHVPTAERAAVPVVRTGPTGSVLWVAGVRPDERARALPGTRVLLELTLLEGLEAQA